MKYFGYLLFFGAFLTILLICKGDDITQKCFANDSFSLLYGCKFLEVRYPAPLYTFIGWPIANLPFGVDGGNLILFLSVIPAFITSILVFVIVKKKSENKLAPWIGAATLMGSYPFFSQALIIEVYMLLSMLMVAGYCAIIYGRYKIGAIFIGLAMACHYMTGAFIFVALLVAYKPCRKYWYYSIIVFLMIAIVYYFMIPTFKWQPSSGFVFVAIFQSIMNAVSRSGSVLSYTIWETISTFVVGFGLSLIPIWLYLRNVNKSYWLIFLIFMPLTYIITQGSIAFVTLVPFVPFLAIAAGVGIEKLNSRYIKGAILIFSLCMLLSMPFTINISALDNDETTARKMINELDKLNDGDIVLGARMYENKSGYKTSDTLGGNVIPLVEYYNKETGREIIPIFISYIYFPTDRMNETELEEKGVNFPSHLSVKWLGQEDHKELWTQKVMIVMQLVNLDRDVYWYEYTDFDKEELVLVKVVDGWDPHLFY